MEKRQLTAQQVKSFQADGFVCLPGFFDRDELEDLRRAYAEDPTVNGQLYGMADSEGRGHPICIWTELGDDMIGMIPRIERMVAAAETLLGEECYHWHSKLTVKPPYCRALVDWHQDFASWYDDGVMFPHLLTVGIAIEPATSANGCLQIVPGSHRMGRLDANSIDGDTKTFDRRVERATQKLGVVSCELDVGDAVFFHCNTLHGSGANETETTRLMLFASYNAASNEPVAGAQGQNQEGAFMNIEPAERKYRPIRKVADDALAKRLYQSAFHHTPFKQPRMDLGGPYTQAARISEPG